MTTDWFESPSPEDVVETAIDAEWERSAISEDSAVSA